MPDSEILVIAEDDFDEVIADAAEVVRDGLVVGIPTDTVYVLTADPFDPGPTERLFSLKHRPRTQDLSVLVGGIDQALGLATAVPAAAKVLMERFWPGPLTLVLPSNPDRPVYLGEDELTIGLRMADHPVPLALCREVGALAATPAGVQGQRVFSAAADVAAAFGKWVPLVLDGGVCDGAQPTVVDATGEDVRLLREGRLAWSEIEAALA